MEGGKHEWPQEECRVKITFKVTPKLNPDPERGFRQFCS